MARKRTMIAAPADDDGDGEQDSKDKLGFGGTLWTDEVVPAGSPDEKVRLEALAGLLSKYRSPLKNFLIASFKWKFRVNQDWIEDCLQSFVAEKVMMQELIRKAKRERGRFRDFLK